MSPSACTPRRYGSIRPPSGGTNGGARRFVAEVDRSVARIAAGPERNGWYDDEFREAAVRRFPYSVIYRIEPAGDVLVVAIAHASREPGYWQGRA